MGVMQKMRNSTSSILWILIFSFGILWVLADTQVFDAVAVGPQNLGTVNGEPITLQEYNNRVAFYTDQFNQRTGGETMTPEMRSIYENQAWEDLVAAQLIQQKMSDLGIAVTDNELVEMITGENPDPFIRQQFQAEDGTIDRIALRAAIEAPENSQAWIMIEQQLRDKRRQEKMSTFISSGLAVSSKEVEREYVRGNSFADIEYLRFPYSEIDLDEISVTDDELREYYQNNTDRFERSETYTFRYVSWDKTPTAEDTTNVIREVEDLRLAFENAEDDSLFLERYQSAVPYRGGYVDVNDIREEYTPVIDLEEGQVSEVVMINGDPHVFKKIDQRGDEIRFAVLSYPVTADPIGTIDRLAGQAEEFEFFASTEGFMQEAERRELEISEATASKDAPFIPGIGQSQQTVNVLENLNEDEISSPIELNDQFIVVQMVDRIPEGPRPFPEVRNQVENLVRSQKRIEMMVDRVSEFTSGATSIEQIAEEAGQTIETAEAIQLGGTSIPGAGRELTVIGEIFDMEEGVVSGPIEGENAVFIINLLDKSMADPAAMTEAQRTQIRNRLSQEKFIAFNQVFIDELKEDADIVDNRDRLLQQ